MLQGYVGVLLDPLKMYFLVKMGIFHCYVNLSEGTHLKFNSEFSPEK